MDNKDSLLSHDIKFQDISKDKSNFEEIKEKDIEEKEESIECNNTTTDTTNNNNNNNEITITNVTTINTTNEKINVELENEQINEKDRENKIFNEILSIIKDNNSNLLGQYLLNLSGLKKEKQQQDEDEEDDDEEDDDNQVNKEENKKKENLLKIVEKQHGKKRLSYIEKEELLYADREKEIIENNKNFNFKKILNRIIPETNKTLLYTSIESDCFNDIVLLLLKYGSDPNQTIDCCLTSSNEEGSGSGSSSNNNDNNSNNNNNNNNNIDINEINLEYYKKSANIEGPIHLAVRNGYSTVLNLLLDYNVDIDKLDSLDRTPIILSSANGKTECSRLLVLKSCKVNCIDKRQKTALHLAMDGGYDDIATTLTQNGANISLRYHYRPNRNTLLVNSDGSNTYIGGNNNSNNNNYRDPGQDYTDYKDVKILNKLDRFGNIQDGYNHSNPQENSEEIEMTTTTKVNIIENSPPLAPNVPRKYSRRSTINSGLTSNISIERNKKEIEKELTRSIKWTKMIRKINPISDKKFKGKFKSRSIKGIPDRMRSQAWPLLSHAAIEKQKNPDLFNQLVNQHSDNEICIDLDVNRAFRNHIFFRERYGMGQVSLFNVLKVYALYDTGVGYTQGMSSIASLLVMYLSEEDAFWTLHSLMNRPEYSMRSMFLSGLTGLLKMSNIFENLLAQTFPTVKKALDDINLTTTLYSTKWFLIGFLDSFPFHISLRVWDLIFSEGYTIVYSIAMSLFRLNEKALLENKDSFEKCYNILRSFENFEIDEDIFINYVIKHRINPKKIEYWEKKYVSPTSNNTTN